VKIVRVAQHSFLAAPITPASTVLDLGVNTGDFTRGIVAAFGCKVIGVEPVPGLYEGLHDLDGLTVQQVAISADGKPATLYLNRDTCATVDPRLVTPRAERVEVPTITFEALLDSHSIDRAALVKVDIEGAELAMIESTPLATLQRVDQFTIEFHDFVEPRLAPAVAACRAKLRAAGFADMSLSGDNSDVLFVNRERIPFGRIHQTAATLLQKYPRGIRRKLDRRLGRDRRHDHYL